MERDSLRSMTCISRGRTIVLHLLCDDRYSDISTLRCEYQWCFGRNVSIYLRKNHLSTLFNDQKASRSVATEEIG